MSIELDGFPSLWRVQSHQPDALLELYHPLEKWCLPVTHSVPTRFPVLTVKWPVLAIAPAGEDRVCRVCRVLRGLQVVTDVNCSFFFSVE